MFKSSKRFAFLMLVRDRGEFKPKGLYRPQFAWALEQGFIQVAAEGGWELTDAGRDHLTKAYGVSCLPT